MHKSATKGCPMQQREYHAERLLFIIGQHTMASTHISEVYGIQNKICTPTHDVRGETVENLNMHGHETKTVLM